MSVASPSLQRPVRRSVIEARPIRNPDVTSAGTMTKRGWWLVGLNFLVPGSAQVLAGSRKLGRFGLGATIFLWVLLVFGGVCALLAPSVAFNIASGAWVPAPLSLLRPLPLLLVQGLFIGYAVLWIVLTIDTLRLVRLVRAKPLSRIGIPALAIVLVAVSSGAAAYGAQVTGSTREALGDIFGSSAPVVPPSDGYYNILLLGADSGEGRDSMRFDSISVVSVNAETGATTITGIPRDLGHFPFAEGPMKTLYPDVHTGKSDPDCGWGSGINQLRTEVEVCRDGNALYPNAVDEGSEPGIEATKDAAEGLLGISIPYYVFIDMHGFAEMIDALGGVEITVQQRLPKGGGPEYGGQPAEDWAIGWIEAGPQRMDGDTAQWYARSRYTTDDFDRMRRQRELQEAMIAQFTPETVLTRFQSVAAASTNLMETDLPQGLLPTLADLALKAKEQEVKTIELTPEANSIDQEEPDVSYVQELVRDSLHPPTPEPTP
ncbi:LCP family protein [Microbacterium sp. P07]|uniref:LCP family protein n=1 Tax=Microbacterium sp. P07 TaxID=3366952 RepID=UPI003745FC24